MISPAANVAAANTNAAAAAHRKCELFSEEAMTQRFKSTKKSASNSLTQTTHNCSGHHDFGDKIFVRTSEVSFFVLSILFAPPALNFLTRTAPSKSKPNFFREELIALSDLAFRDESQQGVSSRLPLI